MEGTTGLDPLTREGELPPPPKSLTPEWMHLPDGWLAAAGRTADSTVAAANDDWDRPAAKVPSARKAKRNAKRPEDAAVAISTMVSGDGSLGETKSEGTAMPLSLAAGMAVAALFSWAWYQGVLRTEVEMAWVPIFMGILVSWTMRLGVRRSDGIRITFSVLTVLIASMSTMSALGRFGEINAFRTRNLSWLKFPGPVQPMQMISDVHQQATENALPAVMVIVGLIICGVLTSKEL